MIFKKYLIDRIVLYKESISLNNIILYLKNNKWKCYKKNDDLLCRYLDYRIMISIKNDSFIFDIWTYGYWGNIVNDNSLFKYEKNQYKGLVNIINNFIDFLKEKYPNSKVNLSKFKKKAFSKFFMIFILFFSSFALGYIIYLIFKLLPI